MKLRYRIILFFLPVFSVGFYFVYDFIVNEIRPRYLEAVEESLIDTANILATLVENRLVNDNIEAVALDKLFSRVASKTVDAQVYVYKKNSVNLTVYVTNSEGIVVYDSENNHTGEDYSNWNDVYLTLRGKYGARSSLRDPTDEESGAWYVAAAIRHDSEIIGSLTVVKPKESIAKFIDFARKRISIVLAVIFLIMLLLSFLTIQYLTRPFVQLTDYVRRLKSNPDERVPEVSGSEAKALAQAFQKLKNELDGRKYIERYVQSLTHEIKSPLTSITGAVEILHQDLSAEDQNRFLQNINTESHRLHEVVEKLLKLASLENRSEPLVIERVAALDICTEVTDSFEIPFKEKEINFQYFHNDIILEVEPFLFKHAIFNGISNAIDFSKSGGCIFLIFSNNSGKVKVTIEDDGSHIPDYALERIFEHFYSLPRPDTKRKSTGLGLPFIKEVIQLHHGEVTVGNNSQGGVTLAIFLNN